MDRNYISRSLGTHDGSFHADEVTACALLLLFNLIDQDKIIRTRDIDLLMRCEFVCDVGGVYDPKEKLFDHHQVDYQGPMSSAGMILRYLEESDVITHKEKEFLDRTIIIGVDAHDNGRELHESGVSTYSHVISNFNPVDHDADPKAQDAAFFHALAFAKGHFDRVWQRYQYMQSCRQTIAEKMAQQSRYMVFDKNIPWLEIFFELGGERHPAQFIIMPSGHHWKLRGIPPSLREKMKVRLPMPIHWAGLLEDDLRKITGIPGAVFCHKGRFISVWETREDAQKALDMIFNQEGKK